MIMFFALSGIQERYFLKFLLLKLQEFSVNSNYVILCHDSTYLPQFCKISQCTTQVDTTIQHNANSALFTIL